MKKHSMTAKTILGAKRAASKHLQYGYDLVLYEDEDIIAIRRFWSKPDGSFGWDKWQPTSNLDN